MLVMANGFGQRLNSFPQSEGNLHDQRSKPRKSSPTTELDFIGIKLNPDKVFFPKGGESEFASSSQSRYKPCCCQLAALEYSRDVPGPSSEPTAEQLEIAKNAHEQVGGLLEKLQDSERNGVVWLVRFPRANDQQMRNFPSLPFLFGLDIGGRHCNRHRCTGAFQPAEPVHAEPGQYCGDR